MYMVGAGSMKELGIFSAAVDLHFEAHTEWRK